MKIFKTTQEEKAARAWLHDLMIAAGVKTDNKRDTPLDFDPDFVQHAKILVDELLNRNCDDVDKSIRFLAQYPYNASLVKGETIMTQPTPEQIAKYIVYMAQAADIMWDFTNKNNLMEFGGTLLGHQVFSLRQYAWLRDRQSDFRHPAERKVYLVQGVTSGGSQAYAQINPFSYRYAVNDTNQVLFTMRRASEQLCTCYFFDRAEAEAFMEKLKHSDHHTFTDIYVHEQGYTNEDGYMFFGTEFGPCGVTKQDLLNIWKYEINVYKDGNPLDKLSDEAWEAYVEALHREY